MPVAPADSATICLDHIPLCGSITDTPPPVSSLPKSSVGSHGSTAPSSVSMPEPGQEFCGFEMQEELGSGTFARVYLAKQSALAGREVAVKVTLRPTKEPERLARLQHTNIVPVYSVHDVSRAQVICMPYLGRRTLADALTGFRKSHVAAGLSTRKAVATKKGSSVAGSRTRIGRPAETSDPKSGVNQTAVATDNPIVGDVERVLPILLQLADGLDHAHGRGVLHLDLKPANVLLADTGEPMLLDFNLSFAEAEGKREVVGGTIPYMAPEQLLDLQKRGKGTVDARTDLYSLGVMAFELLAGKHPFPVTSRTLAEFDGLIAARSAGAPALREVNPDVPAAVAAIVAKLLAPNPDDRYQTARALREDLDRQLTDRPLKFAPDRSIAERIGKWRRRNPRTMTACLIAAVLCLAGGAGAFAFTESEKRETREAEARVRATRDGLASTRLDLILPDPATRARGMKTAVELLAAYGLPQDPNWRSKPAFQRVPADQQAALAGDLGELLTLLARARQAESKSPEAANDAAILNELGRSCLGENEKKTARDHFLDGAALFASSKFDAAIRPLEKAVAAQPDHGAAQFLLARCRHLLGQFEPAVERYKSAVTLLPKDPRPVYFTGVAHGLTAKHASSEEAFAAAIQLDERFGDAWLGRGISRMEQRQYEDAEADFTKALELNAPRMQALYLRAHVRRLHGDKDEADADLKLASTIEPVRDEDFLVRGYTRMRTAPKEALKDFEAALERNPASLGAHRNRFQLVLEISGEKAALAAADDMIKIFAEYGPARAARALCLARLGRGEDAKNEVQACRKLLSAKGPTYRDPALVYRLALVHAALAARESSERLAAIRVLKEAMSIGYRDFPAMERDRDLDSIRDLPEFKKAVDAAKELAN